MLPSAGKQSKVINFSLNSPVEKANNRSAYLHYFRKIPNNRFLSQQKRRGGGIKVTSISPPRNIKPPAFFHQEKEKNVQVRHQSYSIIKSKGSKIFPIKIVSNQSPIQKVRRKTQQTTSIKFSIRKGRKNSNIIQAQGIKQIIKNNKNCLTEFEQVEIQEYEEVFYEGENCLNKIQKLQDMKKEDGGYKWVKGDHLGYRYQIMEELGQGSFGQVFKCFDHKLKTKCAVKLVKDNQKYTKQARTQIKILNIIKAKDYLNNKNCVHLKDFFKFRNRMCLTFDLLSINLYELTKNNGYYGFALGLIRRFCLQLLNALHFLHSNNIIHADLKPQNILLKENNKSGLRIIDFGSSCLQNQTIYTYIQSRYYRAPEVILGLPYNRKIDIWSFGCIVAELHLGYPLFAGDDQHQQMCLLVEMLGKPPQFMKFNSKRWNVFFDKQNQLLDHKKKTQPKSKSLAEALEHPENQFLDFLKACFEWMPQNRSTALKLLKHPWILKQLPEQILSQHLKFVLQEQNKLIEVTDQNKNNKKVSFSIRQKRRLI